MGYDKQVITDFLIKNNFDNLLANQVECVYQSDYAVTDEKIRALYTDSLATCIALYAICDDFAFLAHIELGSLSDDFEHEKIGIRYYVTWCNTITELLTQRNIRKDEIKSPINIGTILGTMPVDENNIYRQKIEQGISILESQCAEMNIDVNRVPNNLSEFVFIDHNTKKLMIQTETIDFSSAVNKSK